MSSDLNAPAADGELVQDESYSTDRIADWHWEILQERERLHAEGLDPDIPAEEAFRQIREIFQMEQAALNAQRDEAVLSHREKLVTDGNAVYISWEQAKKEMRGHLGQR